MEGLADRISWAIVKILHDGPYTDQSLGKILGTNKNTIADYRKKKGLIKGSVLVGLATYFNFSPSWILKGEGEPFPGARHQYPEMCDLVSSGDIAHIKEDGVPYNLSGSENSTTHREYRISDALSMCARVLESGTSYATALYLNIQHFDRAISAESRITHVEQNYIKLEAENQNMKIELANIKLEVDKLKENTNDIHDKVAKEMAT